MDGLAGQGGAHASRVDVPLQQRHLHEVVDPFPYRDGREGGLVDELFNRTPRVDTAGKELERHWVPEHPEGAHYKVTFGRGVVGL